MVTLTLILALMLTVSRRTGPNSRQPSAEHFQQCAEFLPLCNRAHGPLAVTVLPVPLAKRAAATACAAVQRERPFFVVAGDRHGVPPLVRA
jgi:hypothetical protein